jgi:hypothetical protein
MNNNGLAFIIGALVIVVGAIVFFGMGSFRNDDSDLNVRIDLPDAPTPSN